MRKKQPKKFRAHRISQAFVSMNSESTEADIVPYHRFHVTDNGETATIEIEGSIGFDWMKWYNDEPQNTFKELNKALKQIQALKAKHIEVKITNSPGGIVSDGIAMYDALVMHPATVTTTVIGYAASISTILMQAGDTRKMSKNAKVLAHKAWGSFTANAITAKNYVEMLEQEDERLLNIYKERGVDIEALKQPLEANQGGGKWILADNALAMGIVDEVFVPTTKKLPVMASLDIKKLGFFAHNQLPDMEDVFNSKDIEQIAVTAADETQTTQEGPMDPKEMEALASLVADKLSANAPAPKEEKTETKNVAVEVAFVGDATNQDDVSNHVEKVRIEQLKAATNWNDINSVIAYQKAAFGTEAKAQAGPQTNTHIVAKAQADKKASEDADRLDTLNALKALSEVN